MGGATSAEIQFSDDLRKFAKNLRSVESDLPKKVTAIFRAELDPIGVEMKARMAADFGKHRKGKKTRASSSIIKRATTTSASIGYSTRNAYVPWLDFGGTLKPVGGRRNTITRPRIKGGRYLYPAVKQQKPIAIPRLMKALDELRAQYLD